MKDVERLEVVAVIDQLLAGHLSRDEAARWAVEREGEEVADSDLMEAMELLVICDEQEYDVGVPGTPTPPMLHRRLR